MEELQRLVLFVSGVVSKGDAVGGGCGLMRLLVSDMVSKGDAVRGGCGLIRLVETTVRCEMRCAEVA